MPSRIAVPYVAFFLPNIARRLTHAQKLVLGTLVHYLPSQCMPRLEVYLLTINVALSQHVRVPVYFQS